MKLEIFKKNDWWKSGWYFEGLVLEPVTGPGQEEQPIPAVPEEPPRRLSLDYGNEADDLF